jgi:Rhodopirellula transposase DDE domain
MKNAAAIERIRQKYQALSPVMDERMRRQWAAAEASSLGWGGVTLVSAATGLARNTIATGLRELEHRQANLDEPMAMRLRRVGGGRKSLTEKDLGLLQALDALIDPVTHGRLESPLRWTCKTTRKLAEELQRQDHSVTDRTVAALLKQAGYSLQANSKTKAGWSDPDRNAQFDYTNRQARSFRRRHQPVVFVEINKSRLAWVSKNLDAGWEPKGKPEKAKAYDFPSKQVGKVIPYDLFNLAADEGWLSVGINQDTALFAVASIRHFWRETASFHHDRAIELMIAVGGGGGNSSRNRLWKVGLQDLANDTGLILQVCHCPPGTTKWNIMGDRLFCFITENWRGRQMIRYEVIVNLIDSTTPMTRWTRYSALGSNECNPGIDARDEQLARVKLTRAKFHGDWNYTIRPRR